MTTRATKRNHSQSGGPKPRQKPKSGQTVQTDGAQGLAFCSVVELQLGQSLWQLDLHPDPTVAWEDREGAVPCADSCDSIDWVNPTEVVVRQLGAQPAYTPADINSSAAELTQGSGLTHTQREAKVALGEVNHQPPVIQDTQPILMGCCAHETVLRCMCVCGSGVCTMHMRVWRRQLPGDGQGALPSASLRIKEKPPVILASLQAPTHRN
ncbi:hypothetical protein JOQ06_029126 [Pogonophryne albipinna]|uniref:Uncharacterized protein n=1 Tax=Pogonophryne albipinna TaxID=1090488 RepID=A0AAD6BBF5_9TELE|nr:hypothetical protein JOQ06_029126 [Pogonophryne albipinna]